MPHSLRIAYFAHSLRSDWNNGNAHFLRGLMRHMVALGHSVQIHEPERGWSIENLRAEERGLASLEQFDRTYPELNICPYTEQEELDFSYWRSQLASVQIVIFHEWNSPQLARLLLDLREKLGYSLLFHDTHHRASSSPEEIACFGVQDFDGVLAFGDALRNLYIDRYGVTRVWTLHEAADTMVFKPHPNVRKNADAVWIGNWGDDERSREICEYLLRPAVQLRRSFRVYGVRYPDSALDQLARSGVQYGGYIANLEAPMLYAESKLALHIPRQQYVQVMKGIPTIRVFEALACGIPLISAPWQDTEGLFREGDYLIARNSAEMSRAIEHLLTHPVEAEAQSLRGLETILARHTCRHRAEQLTSICEAMIP